MAVLEEETRTDEEPRQHGIFSALSAEAARVAEQARAGVVVVRGEQGQGSGVVWPGDGIILTNDHVVADDRTKKVELADGREFQATVFRRDPARDLAALRVNASDLPVVPIGDSRALRPGELILAVGNPLGLSRAVTVGIVSSPPSEVWVGRRRMPEMVRADVDLYPGNSGGPLVNAEGRVVGINSMVIGPGMALAIPSHAAEAFLAGATGRAFLGMTVRGMELPAEIAGPLGVAPNHGMMIFELARGGPAEQAGLLPGDLLIAMDGKIVAGTEDLTVRLARLGPNRATRLSVLRAGRLLDVPVVPTEREEMARAA